MDRVFIDMLPNSSCTSLDDDAFVFIGMDGQFSYLAFWEDFGPLNLASVYRFCHVLRETRDAFPSKNILVFGDNEKSFTNAAFLVGAHLIIDHGQSPHEVKMRFEPVSAHLLSYCDVSPGHSKFVLHLQDCWEALARAIEIGWLDFSSGPSSFDPEEYDHYASPLNADLNVIIPDKFIAMAGPVSFGGGGEWRDTESGCRQFAPHFALEFLRDFDVQAVVRLNEPEYDETILSRGGIAVVDLFFEDCSNPPPDVVLKFMTIAERLEGPIAVHCKAGLGRTGTLIALYLMKHHGFTARQAIAWLRIVRPGSVIGQQQDFLCSQDKHMPRAREVYSRTVTAASSSIRSSEGCQPSPCLDVVACGAPVDRVKEVVSEIFRSVDRLMLRRRPTPVAIPRTIPAAWTRWHSASSLTGACDTDDGGKRPLAGASPRTAEQGDGVARANMPLADMDAAPREPSSPDAFAVDSFRRCISEVTALGREREEVPRPLRSASSEELADHVTAVAERRKAALAAWRTGKASEASTTGPEGPAPGDRQPGTRPDDPASLGLTGV